MSVTPTHCSELSSDGPSPGKPSLPTPPSASVSSVRCHHKLHFLPFRARGPVFNDTSIRMVTVWSVSLHLLEHDLHGRV